MTDEKLIYQYLNRHYTVVFGLTKNMYNKADDGIEIGNVTGEGTRAVNDVKTEVVIIFKGIKLKIIEDTFTNWLNENIQNVVRTFHEFLNDCELVLGLSDWVIIHKKYGEVNQKLLKNYYHGEEKPYLVTLQHLIDKWYDDKIFEASEKQWRNLW